MKMLIPVIILAAIILFALVANDCRASDSVPARVHFDKPIDLNQLYHAIAKVEDAEGRTGKHGEHGPLQRKPANLAQYGKSDIAYCHALLMACDDLGKPRSVWLCALVHNAGFTAVKNQQFTEAQQDFSARVTNVYFDETADGK